MEFKKPNKRSKNQHTSNTPPRDPSPALLRPAHQSKNQVYPPRKTRETARQRPLVQKTRLSTKTFVFSAITIITVSSILVAWLVSRQQDHDKKSQAVATAAIKQPEGQTALPSGKSIDTLGGWQRVSPPDKEPVFAYTDTINDIAISVSQQSLPKTFKTNTASHIAELAKKFNATTKIDANGTPVYIGTSSKGPQSAIFTQKDLLIMIKSQKHIDDTSWSRYISSLQ